ncbi:MAG: transposase [Opitutaceae bacterium]|nr:transposase [Opitutaceae bacterium]
MRRSVSVIWVWDRAGIDFELWQNWKATRGIYFISRTKDNMTFTTVSQVAPDPDRPIDPNILSDERCLSSQGTEVRLIRYRDPVGATVYEFVTTAFHLPADIIAWLYKARWNIEKVFDQLKTSSTRSRLGQPAIRRNPSKRKFLCLAHNLLELFEVHLENDYRICNEAGLQRREKGSPNTLPLPGKGYAVSALLTKLFQPLQCSIKLIRWLRSTGSPAPSIADPACLARSYAHS